MNSTTVIAVTTAGLLAYLLGVGVLRFISDNIADSVAPAGLMAAPLLAGKLADLGLDGIALLIAYIAVGLLAEGIIFGTAHLLYTSVERGQATLGSRLVLVILALSFASLVWLLLMLG